jgi:hypothetical protein
MKKSKNILTTCVEAIRRMDSWKFEFCAVAPLLCEGICRENGRAVDTNMWCSNLHGSNFRTTSFESNGMLGSGTIRTLGSSFQLALISHPQASLTSREMALTSFIGEFGNLELPWQALSESDVIGLREALPRTELPSG